MEKTSYAARPPVAQGEPLKMEREDHGHWHARDAAGALIARDKYQNDLVPRLTGEGFTVTKVGE